MAVNQYVSGTIYQNGVAVQPTLVSGNNIKTVNSTSLLGSGNVAVQPTLVSGTNIKTVNGGSLLGSGDLTVSGSGLKGVHAVIPLSSGEKTNVTLIPSGSASSSAFTADRMIAYPFIPNQTIVTSDLYMNVLTGVAGSLCRIAIFSDLNGKPYERLLLTPDFDCSTGGIKTALATFTFTAGTIYWLVFHGGATTSTITQVGLASTYVIRAQAAIGNMGNSYYSNVTFSAGTPSVFISPILQVTNVPFIGITKA